MKRSMVRIVINPFIHYVGDGIFLYFYTVNLIRKIAPFLLLSVFSITQLHAIFPHDHHDHSSDILHLADHHHSDDHFGESEHTSDNLGDNNSASDFFNHLFEGHSHQHVPVESMILTDDVNCQTKSKHDIVPTVVWFDYGITLEENKQAITNSPSSAILSVFYLSSLSRRGPPSLV